jgi:hypothetical protein
MCREFRGYTVFMCEVKVISINATTFATPCCRLLPSNLNTDASTPYKHSSRQRRQGANSDIETVGLAYLVSPVVDFVTVHSVDFPFGRDETVNVAITS